MNSKNYIVAFLILIFSLSSHATFKKASKLYDEQQFEQAYNMYFDLAQIGHKPSQFNIGIMYLEGTGVKKDLIKAYSWVKLSDESKGQEQDLLSEIKSKIPESSLEHVEDYYSNIYSQYSDEAIKQAYAPNVNNDEKETITPKAIKQSNPEYPTGASMRGYTGWVLLEFDLSSNGYPIDIIVVDSFPKGMFAKVSLTAVKRWRFEPLETKERYKYKMDFRLEGFAKSDKQKYELLDDLREEAVGGNPSSQYMHARYGGYNVADEASFSPTSWYYEAARNGVLNAQYELAERLFDGNGCEVNPDKALNWLKISAENDFAPSQFKLAKLAYENGNQQKAIIWLTKALKSNLENESIDSGVTAYRLIDFIYKKGIRDIKPMLILNQLELIDDNNLVNPVRYYQYFSYAYENLGDIEESIGYLEEAIETLEDLGEEMPPQEMLDRLAFLEAKVS